jgi:hypothetical protein
MDAKLFRLPTKPNFYTDIATANPFDVDQRQKYSHVPTYNSRYPGWAAPMEDGRLVTTYQNHCSRNVPTGKQFATKEWMTKNATELIRVNRDRYAHQTGAIYGVDMSTVLPPEVTVKCETDGCQRRLTGVPGGIGTEREGAEAPPLFGTWDPKQSFSVAPRPNVALTRHYEGGRNTPRGNIGPREMA